MPTEEIDSKDLIKYPIALSYDASKVHLSAKNFTAILSLNNNFVAERRGSIFRFRGPEDDYESKMEELREIASNLSAKMR